jgi:hypothetical protein
LEIQLLRGEDWDSINRFNPDTFLFLSKPVHGFPMSYFSWIYN